MKSQRKKRIIINADDFGWDDLATEAIIKLAECGSVTSTTVMANMVAPVDLENIKKTNISVGVHINLISGSPLNKKSSSSIIDPKTNEFYPASALWMKFLQGKVKEKDIKSEISAQVNFLRDHNIPVSHADSHQHVHIFPGIDKVIVDAVKSLGIKKLRNCNIPEYWDSRRFIIKAFNLYSSFYRRGILSPGILLSTFSFYKEINTEIFQKSVSAAFQKADLVELMVHPGLENRSDSYLQRKQEYDFLVRQEWKAMLQNLGVELISWDNI